MARLLWSVGKGKYFEAVLYKMTARTLSSFYKAEHGIAVVPIIDEIHNFNFQIKIAITFA